MEFNSQLLVLEGIFSPMPRFARHFARDCDSDSGMLQPIKLVCRLGEPGSIVPTLNRLGISFGETVLVPVRVGDRSDTGGIQPRDLIGREVPADGPEICAQLRLITRPDDQRGHRRSLEHSVECDPRNGFAGFLDYFINRVSSGG
jgi:hypothetical protein